MSDKKRSSIPTSKMLKNRPSAVSAAGSRAKLTKEKTASRTKHNTTVLDTTVLKQEGSIPLPDVDATARQIAYGKFLRDMLAECISDEKIEREETHIDVQMSMLADRFSSTIDLLSKTNTRLKDISFVAEQKRLLDLKSNDCSQFYQATDLSNSEALLQHLSATEQEHLDRLQLKNVDFGYNEQSGHQQLLDAVNETINGLEYIKKNSGLDRSKFEEYKKSEMYVKNIEKDKLDFQNLKHEFDNRFPKFSEKLIKEASEKIAEMIDEDDDDDDDSY